MTQPELFTQRTAGHLVFEEPVLTVARRHDPLPPFAASSETSRDAAIKKHDRNNSHSQREQILVFIAAQGAHGATRDEIEVELECIGIKGNTLRPRLKELLGEAKGYTKHHLCRLMDCDGKPVYRKTRCGLNAEVLIQHE